ncbi:hypothetical protein OIU85_002906 [Salix viminalis]|uniref:K Homology domain-containing protein n=1 Tax=Salix viminalis TaxID=40686 RepID=A0A9Q0ZZJ0_SALVM|nr:hypothetical protein OIU85_002906 [Salix viminalis]
MQSSKAPAPMEVEIAPREQKSEGVLPAKPKFEPLKAHEMSDGRVQFRKVSVPPHRYTPLKKAWMEIYTPVYEQMKIDIRMNLKARKVFDVIDAIALLRLDELYVESFEIKDVKTLRGEHLSRAIGRLSGKGGKTKFAIENATKTRIVIADTKIHILGSFQNIKVARDSLCSLILGSPAGKVGKAVAKPGNGRSRPPCKSFKKKNYYYMNLVLQKLKFNRLHCQSLNSAKNREEDVKPKAISL